MKHIYSLVAMATFCLSMFAGTVANAQNFKTTGYCPAGSLNGGFYKISLLSFGSISNSSTSNAGYEDFTNLSTDLQAGSLYNSMTVVNPFSDGETAHNLTVYIDFNHDFDFDDAGETIYFYGFNYSANDYISFDVPADAIAGSTRLRIRLDRPGSGQNSTPCGDSGDGQVEDYTVNILCATTYVDTTATSCNKFTWRGTTYTASGDYDNSTFNAQGCETITTLHLTLTTLTTNFTKMDATCFGSATGSLEVTPTSGVSPYTYRIGTTTGYVSSGNFTSLKAGSYRVSVMDAAGCSGTTLPITIGQSAPIAATANRYDVACYNTYTGSIAVNVNNPVLPNSFSLGTSGVYQSSNTFSNLRAGTYRVTIQDGNGCKNTLTNLYVEQPLPIKIVVNSVNHPNNAAYNNGSIQVSGTGGNGSYQFKFGTAGAYQPSGTFTNLKAGTYRIYVKDRNDCVSASVVVTLSNSSALRSNGVAQSRQVTEMASTENISIAPNPTTTAFKVSVKGTQNEVVNLRVMDVNGKVVYTAQSRANQSFTFGEGFMVGMYMVEVRQGNEVKILKAVKMK